MTDFDVALCQYELGTARSVPELLTAVRELFDRAGAADLYVLPELLCSDLRLTAGDTTARELALEADERETYRGFLADAAAERDAVVVGGSYNVLEGDAVYNRLPLATPDRLLTYDKCHPTPGEREAGKSAGEADPPVVEHRGVGVGVANCYDAEFPEAVRRTAAAGAEVLAVPSWTGSEAGFQRVRRCGAARAVENQLFVAHVPVVGSRGDAATTGRAAVYAPCDDVLGPHGTRLSLPKDERAAGTCNLDVAGLRRSRESAAVRPYTDAGDVFGEREEEGERERDRERDGERERDRERDGERERDRERDGEPERQQGRDGSRERRRER